jgi:hypothetical protein
MRRLGYTPQLPIRRCSAAGVDGAINRRDGPAILENRLSARLPA